MKLELVINIRVNSSSFFKPETKEFRDLIKRL